MDGPLTRTSGVEELESTLSELVSSPPTKISLHANR